jgi:hypothetical protein
MFALSACANVCPKVDVPSPSLSPPVIHACASFVIVHHCMTHSLHFLFGLSSRHQVVFTRQTPARRLTAMLTPIKTAAVWAAVSTVLAQVGTVSAIGSGRSDGGPVPDVWFANASAALSRSRRQAYGPANGYHPCTESTGGSCSGCGYACSGYVGTWPITVLTRQLARSLAHSHK